jgi:hypothetical protein
VDATDYRGEKHGRGIDLTLQLREPEAEGLVHREVYPLVPPRAEYSLTGKEKASIRPDVLMGKELSS